jgi:hypothetical protein
VKACIATGRHVIALEDDRLIFDALLAPLAPAKVHESAAKARITTPPVNPNPAKKPKRQWFTTTCA